MVALLVAECGPQFLLNDIVGDWR